VERLCGRFEVSERRACRVVHQARSTQRHRPGMRDDEGKLTARVEEPARLYGRYGYRPPAPEAFEPWPPGSATLRPPAMAAVAEELS